MTRARWADLNFDVLQAIYLQLHYRTKISCDVVCKSWRNLLCHQPSSGIWAQPFLLTDNANCAKMWQAILIPPAARPLPAVKVTSMANWFRRRAGVQCICFGFKYSCLEVDNSDKLSVMYWLLHALAEAEPVPDIQLHWRGAAIWRCCCTSKRQCVALLGHLSTTFSASLPQDAQASSFLSCQPEQHRSAPT